MAAPALPMVGVGIMVAMLMGPWPAAGRGGLPGNGAIAAPNGMCVRGRWAPLPSPMAADDTAGGAAGSVKSRDLSLLCFTTRCVILEKVTCSRLQPLCTHARTGIGTRRQRTRTQAQHGGGPVQVLAVHRGFGSRRAGHAVKLHQRHQLVCFQEQDDAQQGAIGLQCSLQGFHCDGVHVLADTDVEDGGGCTVLRGGTGVRAVSACTRGGTSGRTSGR